MERENDYYNNGLDPSEEYFRNDFSCWMRSPAAVREKDINGD